MANKDDFHETRHWMKPILPQIDIFNICRHLANITYKGIKTKGPSLILSVGTR
jgi:hypothetical protein